MARQRTGRIDENILKLMATGGVDNRADTMSLLAGGKVAEARGYGRPAYNSETNTFESPPMRNAPAKVLGGPSGVMFPEGQQRQQEQVSPEVRQAMATTTGATPTAPDELSALYAAMGATSPAAQMELRRQMKYGGGLGIDRKIRAAQGGIKAADEQAQRQAMTLERIRAAKVEPVVAKGATQRDVANIKGLLRLKGREIDNASAEKIATLDDRTIRFVATMKNATEQDRIQGSIAVATMKQVGLSEDRAAELVMKDWDLKTQIEIMNKKGDIAGAENLSKERRALRDNVTDMIIYGQPGRPTEEGDSTRKPISAGPIERVTGADVPEKSITAQPAAAPASQASSFQPPSDMMDGTSGTSADEEEYNAYYEMRERAKDINDPFHNETTPFERLQIDNKLKEIQDRIKQARQAGMTNG